MYDNQLSWLTSFTVKHEHRVPKASLCILNFQVFPLQHICALDFCTQTDTVRSAFSRTKYTVHVPGLVCYSLFLKPLITPSFPASLRSGVPHGGWAALAPCLREPPPSPFRQSIKWELMFSIEACFTLAMC